MHPIRPRAVVWRLATPRGVFKVFFLPIASEKKHDGSRLKRGERMTAISIVTCISEMSLPSNGWHAHESNPFSYCQTVLTLVMEHESMGLTAWIAQNAHHLTHIQFIELRALSSGVRQRLQYGREFSVAPAELRMALARKHYPEFSLNLEKKRITGASYTWSARFLNCS